MNLTNQELRDKVEKLTRDLSDRGKLVEAGWVSYQVLVLPQDAPPIQVSECRMAFFAGAQHLFGSLMGILESGLEPTDNDMRRVDMMQKELDTFISTFKARLSG